MSYSIRRYTGTGATQVLDVPPYLDRSHIKVFVAGLPSTSWTWVTDQTISIVAAFGATVAIQRLSSPSARLTDYLSGVTLTEEALDQDSLQAFYLSQEARDVYDDLAGIAAGPLDTATAAAVSANASAGQSLTSATASQSSASSALSSLNSLLAAAGAALVGYVQDGVGAVTRTVRDRLRDTVNIKDFGAVGDGVTNDTAAIQAAMNAMMTRGGGKLYAPRGTYLFTSDLVPPINGTTSRFFHLIGDGMEVTRFVSNNGKGLKIYADTPPARTNVFIDLVLKDFEVCNTGGVGVTKTGIGIDIYSMQRSRISGVRSNYYNYGINIRSSWNNTIDGRSQFDNNNVGIKVPKIASGQEGFNSIDIRGCSAANNSKAGVSLGCGGVVSISNLLVESCPVGIFIPEGCSLVTLKDLYYEAGGVTATQVDRNGAAQTYILYMGKDEDGVAGNTALPSRDVTISHAMRHFGGGAIYIDNVNGVYLPDDQSGRAYTTLGPNVQNVRANGISGLNAISSPLAAGKGRSITRNVLRNFGLNWIANGNFLFNTTPFHALTATPSGTATSAISSKTLNGLSTRTFDITCPNGATTVAARFDVIIPAGSDYSSSHKTAYASFHALASSSDIATASIELVDSNGTVLATTTKTGGLTTWHVVSVEEDMNRYHDPITVLYVIVRITRTTGTGVATYSLEEIVVSDVDHAMIDAVSPFDSAVGLTGLATPSTLSGAWYYTDVVTPFPDGQYFEAQLQAIYTGSQTVTELQYEKLGGADAGKLRIWSSRNVQCLYTIKPRTMILP